MAAGASRSEGRGDDGIRGSAWLEGVGVRLIVARRPQETFGHQRHCDEPRWSPCGSRGLRYWRRRERASAAVA